MSLNFVEKPRQHYGVAYVFRLVQTQNLPDQNVALILSKYLPGANPPYLVAEDKDIHYRKAFSYKIIFRVLKKAGEVFILTIRNDAEDTGKIKDEL